jgi:hypothetical protein
VSPTGHGPPFNDEGEQNGGEYDAPQDSPINVHNMSIGEHRRERSPEKRRTRQNAMQRSVASVIDQAGRPHRDQDQRVVVLAHGGPDCSKQEASTVNDEKDLRPEAQS